MKMKMKESKFGAPAGIYAGVFLACEPMPVDPNKPRIGNDGKQMGPALEWQFRIDGGEQDGQLVGRITADYPTTKNSCGTLLSGLVGRVVGPDEEIDVDQYKGQPYQIVIGPSKGDPTRTQVTQIVQMKANGRAPLPAPASAPAASAPPRPATPPAPPRPSVPGGQPTPAHDPGAEEFWIDDGEEVVKRTRRDIGAMIRAEPSLENRLKAMKLDQSGGWCPLATYGLQLPF